MKLEQSFEVAAPIAEVWAALIDVQRIAPCLPGAEITDAGDDGTYRGNFQVKLGPTTASYRGTLKMESLDETTRTVTMSANGQDKRGQGGAKATIVSTMAEAGAGTRVDVDTDFTITGRLARFGRSGMIEDISKRLLRDFSQCLQETIGSEPAEEAPAPPTAEVQVPPAPVAETAPGGARAPAPVSRSAPQPAPRPAKPVKGFSLLLAVLLDRLRGLFRRGR